MRIAVRLFLLFNLLTITASFAVSSDSSLRAMRKTFLQAEQYLKQDRESDYFALADSLKNYPLYPYLQYQWLRKHLDDNDSILAFLHDYTDSRYAPLLHTKWLTHLGQTQQWPTFIQNYKKSDNSELQCYFAQAQYQNQQQAAALETAKQFWLSGKSMSTACDSLFETLKTSASFNSDLVWQRFQAALKQNNSQLATQLLPLFAQSDRKMADIWLKLHIKPHQITEPAAWKKSYPDAGILFAHAIVRWLEDDPQAALQAWDAKKKSFEIPADIIADTEKRLGMELAFRHDRRAYPLLSEYAGNDESAKEWRVRAALSQQNWQDVLTAIDALSQSQKSEDKWQYWQAKALAATGQQQQADSIFQAIAKNRSFYAFMAAELLKQDIVLNHQPVLASNKEISQLQNNSEFQAVSELLAIDRRPEATRQWWHAISELDAHQMTVAAKLAEQWQWPSLAIFTVAKANYWDDMALRFPLIYNELIQDNADKQKLDPSLIFALIRQESAFDEFAGSSAGAMGLMQLMPKTAKQIAAELNENWSNNYNLVIPGTNIRYGSFYFKKVLNELNDHFVLATAAYNAGPYRVKQWLPKTKSLPADIWIETIPYKETRGYIASVIMYAMIYQHQLHRNSFKISDLLLEIKPS
ncbi:lytic transglycosylase [Methylomonas lenta]|uniref:Lytic transglycosylase n=1 Tax=Methylomonas lenta TaxID=980561 RepID=A0A177NIT7_9GAMM|nr:transglycosylase SLT domain-containing protein [Methylomonas lenta]OAI17781.1 lytic transglycosylase [Methylomonas lenta]